MHRPDWRPYAVFLLSVLVSLPAAGGGPTRAAGFATYVDVPGAKPVAEATCATCHEAVATSFTRAFHKQLDVGCQDCHGNGSLHAEAGGDVSKIVSLTKRTADAANGVCLGCHVREEKMRHWLTGSHASSHLRCTDCHHVHEDAQKGENARRVSFDTSARGASAASLVSPETNVKLRSRTAGNDACIKCHPTEAAQLGMPYHHPLREGKMSCVDCHDPHGGPAGNNLRTGSTNELCLECHAQYRGPFTYQHPPVTEDCLACHSPHGSPNTNLLSVSMPALCLQCHAGHHNGEGLPIPDRCTNCHSSIHGTDIATPSGGSRFVDKGPYGVPSEASLAVAGARRLPRSGMAAALAPMAPVPSHVPTYGIGVASGLMALAGSERAAPLSGGGNWGPADQATTGMSGSSSEVSITTGSYRSVGGSGFQGRAGEYDSLRSSAGADGVGAFVSAQRALTMLWRGAYLSHDDYAAAADLSLGDRLEAGFDVRSFVQQQDHRLFYTGQMSSDFLPPDGATDLVPSHTTFGVTRRLGTAFARLAVPGVPVHAYVKAGWQTRAGTTQLQYLDENTTATCGELCHHQSQLQGVDYTTRHVAVGADVDLGPARVTAEHRYSSFSNRLPFPTGNFGPFNPEEEGFSLVNPPPAGPAPMDVVPGNYFVDVLSPNRATTDSLGLTWTASPAFGVNGAVSYTRLRNLLTGNPQNRFDTDNTLRWRPLPSLRIVGDFHQHNLINDFTPYYSLYGDVSYHNRWGSVRGEYELLPYLDAEVRYRRDGVTRSNAERWPQIYSIDNTDLLTVVPSTSSNTVAVAMRYHDRDAWSGRAGYAWTGTTHPGYLTVPGTAHRIFADVWLRPTSRVMISNDFNAILQSDFPAVPLPNTPGDFQRTNRFYTDTASVTIEPTTDWHVALGYSYQRNTLVSYMAFQNDAEVGYVVDEPAVPYEQYTHAAWGESTYTFKGRGGFDFRLAYNGAHGGLQPDVNPANAAALGNAALIAAGQFDPSGLFPAALGNLALAAGQVSGVVVPQWIAQARGSLSLPRRFEGGLVFYYGRYRDQWNPDLNGVLRTFTVYVSRRW